MNAAACLDDMLSVARAVPEGMEGPAPSRRGAAEDGLGLLERAILDHLGFGVMVVEGGWGVPFANRAAISECGPGGSLVVEEGRLVIALAADRGRLAHCVQAARQGRWSLVMVGEAERQLTLAVLPLRHVDGQSLVLLLFGLRHDGESLAIQLFASACDLTPSETRVLCALAEGLAPHEIASRHQVLMSTVRTQLSAVRSKTGVRSITNLTRALVSLPPVMPASLSARGRSANPQWAAA